MASTTKVVSPLGNVAGTVEPIVQPCSVACSADTAMPSVPRASRSPSTDAEDEQVVDRGGVERVEGIRRRTVDHGAAHPGLGDDVDTRRGAQFVGEVRAEPRHGVRPTGLHDVGTGELGLQRAGQRGLRRGGEHRHEPDEGDPDHQRRRRPRRALRVPCRVARGELTAEPAQPERPSEHLGDRAGEHRAEDGHADERRQRADTDQCGLAAQTDEQRCHTSGGEHRTGDRPATPSLPSGRR